MCTGHEDSDPVWQIEGVWNTVAIETSANPAVLQLIKRFGLSRRLIIRTDHGLSIGHRPILVSRFMDDTYENMPCCWLNRDRACTLSRLDDVSACVQLRARFADLADEDVNSLKGDPIPVLD